MRTSHFNANAILKAAVLVATLLLFGASASFAQQVVNLTAAPTTTVLPDGNTVPMWGYFCGVAATGSTAICGPLNPNSVPVSTTTPATWSPVVITVPTGQGMTINLTNSLSFLPAGNTIPTSIVIVGQVGGGLGLSQTTTPSPDHSLAQGCPTWFIASSAPGQPCTPGPTGPLTTPPTQGPRVQSMSTEVAAGATTTLTWPALKPGTYLLESGTHPSIQVPMGLIGMLVVTAAPSGATAGTAYPGVAATTTTAAAPAVPYNAEVPLEFSEIDPVLNKNVNIEVNTAGFSETKVWSGMVGQCGNPNSPVGVVNTCYPPIVNYTPFYYLINGVAFNKTNAPASLFPAKAGIGTTALTTGIAGTVLVRMVNAGLRMHVPSIVGSLTQGFNGAGAATKVTVSGFTLIAEDGNVIPGVAPAGATTVPAAPRVQTDVFMAAGKVFDVMVNVPTLPTGATAVPSLPVYDRELSLSANSSTRDAGMLAYIGVNNSGLPVTAGTGVFAAAKANDDTYNSLALHETLTVSDVSKGVIANDVNVNGVNLLAQAANGVVTLNANGTFTYTPNATSTATTDSFTYCANNGFTAATTAAPAASCSPTTLMATVHLGPSALAGNPTAGNLSYTSKMATFLKIPPPGVLSAASDPNGLPLQVVLSSVTPTGITVNMDATGGFTASLSGTPTGQTIATFTYTAQNSQGRVSNSAMVTITFPKPSNLQVRVVDGKQYNTCNLNSTCISALVPIPDYRWIIEEDKTFWVDPNCTTNTSITTAGCPAVVAPGGTATIPTFGVNFHTSSMDFVAQGCTGPLSCEGGQTMLDTNPLSATFGQHINAVCDLGLGACRPDPTGNGLTQVSPNMVALDPSKRYYISVLPGDAANPFPAYLGQPLCDTTLAAGTTTCGHAMSGAPVPPACNVLTTGCTSTSTAAFAPVTVISNPTPSPTGKLSVIVFEDDSPLNGEQDGGGGGGTIAPIEPGLGGFNLVLWDTYGGLGDFTGQDSNDAFNQPLSNSLSGTVDPVTGLDACPVTATPTGTPDNSLPSAPQPGGITGMIVTCPKYEADGKTLSPLAGQAVIANLMPDKFSVQAYPGADRIARGEQWVQTNTLDGQHPHDAFIRLGEPSYFQEYGPAGYHVAIGFANPKIINARHDSVCRGLGTPGTVGPCNNTIDGQVNVERASRTPDQRLYPSGSREALIWTQCWASLGDPDGEDFEFTFCDAEGNFKFTNVPGGQWRVTIGDQWNDQIIDGLSTPANVGCSTPNVPLSTCAGNQSVHLGKVGVAQWQSNLYTTTFIDDNKNGIKDPGEIGIPLVYTMIHYRDGHTANNLTTDFDGVANFNEEFPLFNWYVVEADSGRYKTTGMHTVYDAGGPADHSPSCGPGNGARQCGTSTAYSMLSNTYEAVPLPADLSVPGAIYCVAADCMNEGSANINGAQFGSSSQQASSTGRLDPPWVWAEAWSGLTSHGNWLEIGKAPYAACNPALPVSTTNFCATVTTTAPGSTTATSRKVGENGGIHGLVAYAATRPFDDASQMIQQPWQPDVPHVTLNLYKEGFAADGVTPTLTLVDTTQSSSWDDWAQGFYSTGTAGSGTGAGSKPYMSCPGQGTGATGAVNQDLFFFTLFDQPYYLDWYNSLHNGGTLHTIPYNSQYKCYDSMHIGNQLQPAVYDGRYFFPSSLGINPTSGKPLTTLITAGTSPIGKAASLPGTYCAICVANPDTTDTYRIGTPMLPPGKYVVEVVPPAGYEIEKEEDKNLLIGDNLIAPVAQEFAGLGGDIFILPDQASVASLYDPTGSGYNPNNFQNSTTAMGTGDQLALPGFPGFQDPIWPCVGEMRVVPDYLTLFPQVHETGPFAGATRPLCDRKEVTLPDQMSVSAKFFIFTSTHIASKYTGVITDDFTSEFDPFAPQFGEKFSPPNLPVATRDYLGNEVSRVYSDHWGIYDGLTYSSWDVNPPNITGYSPQMMTQCMNDPGPIPGPNGTMVIDPLYNPAYSNFCYELPYMPGLTSYLDTPVVPTEGFVGAGYNNPDCSYPDAMPAIKEADGDGVGPWLSNNPNLTLTITALGDQQVSNSAYSGPSATVAPFNAKTITRHYGFGTRPATCGNGANCPNVTIGGVNANVSSWSDTQIVATARALGQIPLCAVQQQAQYGGSQARCGELVITAGNGKQSIDTVTVIIGGKAPVAHVNASGSIQAAVDAAAPGDLIIVDPTCTTVGATPASVTCSPTALNAATPTQTASVAAHYEMLLMWKPVRLQGVGAASSIIDANANPAGKLLDPWRRHVNCLFGLTLNGTPLGTVAAPGGTPAVYDPNGAYSCPDAGWNYFVGAPNLPQIDRIPLEAVVGWDATVNGNLAEQLQEPSLMGAYEGAGITVLGKGIWIPAGVSPWTDRSEAGAFPISALLLQDAPAALPAVPAQRSYCNVNPNPYPSNFECNPSSIDGLTVRDSSQGGGGIFVHGWAHNLQIGNNRVYNNAGSLSGGITVGQGEFPTPSTITSVTGGVGQQSILDAPPSCQNSNVVNTHLPFCLDVNVNVHNNYITSNSSLGDELFSGTLAGGGGASFCTGADYYKFQYNWVCGNLSSGEGGGVVHLGYIYNGDIEHNTIALNQSTNPTIPTNGGGLMVEGTPDTDPVCGIQLDADCPPGLSDGTGPGLVINANLIQGNMAESGSGGGIRLQQVNGTEVASFPGQPSRWNSVSITNNIIVNNIVGWDGGGISLQDSLNVSIINNTIASNDSLATSGVLTQGVGTPVASAPAGTCVQNSPSGASTASCPQSAGVTSTQNSPLLTTTFTGLTITCPFGAAYPCTGFSDPLLQNNIIYQNRAFHIGVGNQGQGTLNQQKLISVFSGFNGAATPAPVTPIGYSCPAGVSYWDIGVRGDTSPTGHNLGFTLNPTYSVLSDTTGYSTASQHNSASAPGFVSQYCNGSRVPPNFTVAAGGGGPTGFGVPPGIVDATSPNPVFSLVPSATVDEGNNWINVSSGPLALSDDSVTGGVSGNYGGGNPFGNYALTAGSAAIDAVPTTEPNYALVPRTDFFGNPRPDAGNCFDIGAVEIGGSAGTCTGGGGGTQSASLTPASHNFGTVTRGIGTGLIQCILGGGPCQVFALTNTGTVTLTGITQGTLGGTNAADYTVDRTLSTCGPAGGGQFLGQTTLAPGNSCVVTVQFRPLVVVGQPAGSVRNATISVTDGAGTQTSTLTGTTR